MFVSTRLHNVTFQKINLHTHHRENFECHKSRLILRLSAFWGLTRPRLVGLLTFLWDVKLRRLAVGTNLRHVRPQKSEGLYSNAPEVCILG